MDHKTVTVLLLGALAAIAGLVACNEHKRLGGESAAVPAMEELQSSAKPTYGGVVLDGATPARSQKSPACPNGICPGLGNAFYLPDVNALSVNTGGSSFFAKRTLGNCVQLSEVAQSARTFRAADSMSKFISNTMTEADLSGSYATEELTASASASAMTGQDSSLTTTFHSTHMDLMFVTSALDFQASSDCFSAANIEPTFLTEFESLAEVDTNKVAAAASWSPYVSFLENYGSHIMMQQQIGSRFQQWESSTSSQADEAAMLEIKACAEVEGDGEGGGWSAKGCGAYSSDQKRSALKQASNSQTVVLGGTTKARNALAANVTQENLNAFIESATDGNEPIRFIFKPVWQLLNQIYTPLCAASGIGSSDCKNLQRAVNLQAAYEGWAAVGCQQLVDGSGSEYQEMQIASTNSQGINVYQCGVAKTGCRANADCHLEGGGFACYCFGPGCIDIGSQISGTSEYRSTVRGSQSGGKSDGVNQSCTYEFGAYCDCDPTWSGGLPARTIYLQDAS